MQVLDCLFYLNRFLWLLLTGDNVLLRFWLYFFAACLHLGLILGRYAYLFCFRYILLNLLRQLLLLLHYQGLRVSDEVNFWFLDRRLLNRWLFGGYVCIIVMHRPRLLFLVFVWLPWFVLRNGR